MELKQFGSQNKTWISLPCETKIKISNRDVFIEDDPVRDTTTKDKEEGSNSNESITSKVMRVSNTVVTETDSVVDVIREFWELQKNVIIPISSDVELVDAFLFKQVNEECSSRFQPLQRISKTKEVIKGK